MAVGMMMSALGWRGIALNGRQTMRWVLGFAG